MIKGDRLRKLRQDKGINITEAAENLKMSRSQLLNYETEKSDPSTDVLIRLIDYYGVSADFLIGKTDLPRANLVTVRIQVPEVIQKMGFEKAVPWLKNLGLPVKVEPVDIVELLDRFSPEMVTTFLKEMGLELNFDFDDDKNPPPE